MKAMVLIPYLITIAVHCSKGENVQLLPECLAIFFQIFSIRWYLRNPKSYTNYKARKLLYEPEYKSILNDFEIF